MNFKSERLLNGPMISFMYELREKRKKWTKFQHILSETLSRTKNIFYRVFLLKKTHGVASIRKLNFNYCHEFIWNVSLGDSSKLKLSRFLKVSRSSSNRWMLNFSLFLFWSAIVEIRDSYRLNQTIILSFLAQFKKMNGRIGGAIN